jgi:heme A synthase
MTGHETTGRETAGAGTTGRETAGAGTAGPETRPTAASAPWHARPPTGTLAWLTLGVAAFVILQGAVVRSTGAGAGCGSTWPTCDGAAVPLGGGGEAALDFLHRAGTLVALGAGAWLAHRARLERASRPGLFAFAGAALGFLLLGALLGAGAMVWGLAGEDRAVARGLVVATHLAVSLLLVGSLAGAIVYARPRPPAWPMRAAAQGGVATVLLVGLVGMMVLTFSGGIAAMGNAMFPSDSLGAGLAADLGAGSHPLMRLRMLHPLMAVTVGVYLFVALGLAWWLKPVAEARRLAQSLLGVYLLQVAVGTLNLALMAPIVLQLLHLGLAAVAFGLLTALAVVQLGTPQTMLARAPRPALGETP